MNDSTSRRRRYSARAAAIATTAAVIFGAAACGSETASDIGQAPAAPVAPKVGAALADLRRRAGTPGRAGSPGAVPPPLWRRSAEPREPVPRPGEVRTRPRAPLRRHTPPGHPPHSGGVPRLGPNEMGTFGVLRVRASQGAGAKPYRGRLASDGNAARCVPCVREATRHRVRSTVGPCRRCPRTCWSTRSPPRVSCPRTRACCCTGSPGAPPARPGARGRAPTAASPRSTSVPRPARSAAPSSPSTTTAGRRRTRPAGSTTTPRSSTPSSG